MKLYVYDHCPYCVKARMIFGYKKINFELITLLNDDEKTPIDMIGQKMVPILTQGEQHFPESLDIIKKIDTESDGTFISDAPDDDALTTWLSSSRDFVYQLAMPRWLKVGLEEFKTQSAIDYFTKKKEAYIGPFNEHIEKSEAYISMANKHLSALEDMLKGSDFYLGDKASLNDIHLFATLRSLSVVKGVVYPEKVMAYMKKQEELSQVPLHLNIAI